MGWSTWGLHSHHSWIHWWSHPIHKRYPTWISHYWRQFSPRHYNTNVATLALSSWPRQGLAKVWAESETQESHFMFLGCRKVWGNEPTCSQMGSHFGN
jgi:hypothetical protein